MTSPTRPRNTVKGMVAGVSLLVLLVTTVAYLPGLRGPFVFDDRANLFEQPELQLSELSLDALARAARSGESGPLGRPIPMVSFALTQYVAGVDPFPYKATNLAIHILCGILVFLLTRRLLHRLQRSLAAAPFSEDGLRWTSLAVAAIWLAHPLNVTSVLYVVQRMNSVAVLFTLAGLLAYVIGREQVIAGRRRGLVTLLLGVPGFTLLAVLSKENGILLPAFAILIELVFFRLAAAPALARPFRRVWWLIVAAPVIAGLLAAGLQPYRWLGLDAYQHRDFTLAERLLTETRILWFYLRLILLPDIRDMGLYHDDIALSRGLLDPPTTLLAITGIVGLLAAALASWKRQPVLAFGILWFLLGHSLESTVIPLELAHDHRNYLPMLGPVLAIVWYLTLPYRAVTNHPALRYGVVAVYLLLLTFATYARANFWESEWALVNHDVLNHPGSARAHSSLAIALHQLGRHEDAQRHFVAAANLQPSDTSTIIRAVQHHYLWHKQIPDELLAELDHRLQRYPYHTTALWVYEPLIRATRPQPALQKKILAIYERVVTRKDTQLAPAWRAKAEYIIGLEDFYRGDYKKALARTNRALELNNRDPGFYLLACDIHMKLKDRSQVRRLLAELDRLDVFLAPPEQERTADIRRWLEAS